MEKFRFLTSGESHGKGLTAIIEGIPAGFEIDINEINKDLQRRQQFAVEVKGKVKVHNGEITITLSDIAAERLKSHFIENKEKISRMNNNEFVDYLNKQFNLQITGNLNNIKLNKKFFALLKINENELTNNN